jgi:hypothetical protein
LFWKVLKLYAKHLTDGDDNVINTGQIIHIGLGLDKGYLVIFDPSDKTWEEKIYYKEITYNNKEITMVGC